MIDEAHYFIVDASFNNTTDLLLSSLLATTQTVIFLSATTEPLLNYFQYKGYTAYKLYQFKADYSYIDRVLFYYTKEDIIQFINTKVNSKAKMLQDKRMKDNLSLKEFISKFFHIFKIIRRYFSGLLRIT